jgi:hypothetical protein
LKEGLKLDVWSQHETQIPRQRLVLLGASNLTRAFPMVVSLARKTFGGPLSIFAAHGLGRSYGLEAGNLGKKFPGIFFSGLWPALREEKMSPTTAWITDIGNDLAYEAPVASILEWVTGCVERLEQVGARIVLADLPLATLCGVSERRFHFYRALLFPRCRLNRNELLTRAATLSQGLNALGELRNIPVFPARNEWYGLDPIHPTRHHLYAMWRELFGVCDTQDGADSSSRDAWSLRWYLRLLAPESWSHFSISRRANQPQGRLWDSSTVALY